MPPKERHPVPAEEWETVLGLPDDIDGWITKPYFGPPAEEYEAVSGAGALFFKFTLVNAEGEDIANVGYSVGGGWIVQGDGESIEHPLRAKIVKNAVYGQFIDRVVKTLKVDMREYGSPRVAASWDGLGFHWMQESHATVGETKTGAKEATALMPVTYLGEIGEMPEKTAAAPAAKAKAEETGPRAKLADLVGSSEDYKTFQRAALKIPEVAENDELLSEVLDDGPKGFWATHK